MLGHSLASKHANVLTNDDERISGKKAWSDGIDQCYSTVVVICKWRLLVVLVHQHYFLCVILFSEGIYLSSGLLYIYRVDLQLIHIIISLHYCLGRDLEVASACTETCLFIVHALTLLSQHPCELMVVLASSLSVCCSTVWLLALRRSSFNSFQLSSCTSSARVINLRARLVVVWLASSRFHAADMLKMWALVRAHYGARRIYLAAVIVVTQMNAEMSILFTVPF